MGFAERYVSAVNSSDLRDDEHHRVTEALIASALAEQSAESFGALLARVAYADPVVRKSFEAGTNNLAALLGIWEKLVEARGRARQWIKIKAEWDIATAPAFYKRVAHRSLAHWLDGQCPSCHGAKQTPDRRLCGTCRGSGEAEIKGNEYEKQRVLDMVSELKGMLASHIGRASANLRKQD